MKKRIHKQKCLLSLHPLYNIKITKSFKYEPRFNSVFSGKNLPKIKYGAYTINLDDKNSKGTHWVSLVIQKSVLYTLILLELNKFH